MEHHKARHIVEGAVCHVIIFAITHDGRVGVITSEYRIGEGCTLCLRGEMASAQNSQA